MIKFEFEAHSYENIDTKDDFKWISVTRLVHQFVEPFDKVKMSIKCSKGKNPKYKGKTPEEILEMWDKESTRSTTLGSWYHDQRENDVLSCNTITRDGVELPIIAPIMDGKLKLSPEQSLVDGIYPEHLVHLRSAGVCGQADRVEVVGDFLDVYDYKTNKEIKRRGFEFWDGKRKMMTGPLKHLEDCEFNHYALQLSIYMFMIQKHNFTLTPRNIEITHAKFKVESEDDNGFPIIARDAAGDPILESQELIKLPYLRKEVIAMFRWLKYNKEKVLKNAH